MSSGASYDPATDIPDLSGKVILVTGGNSGLGRETIVHLARHNPKHIYFTSRSVGKAEEAVADVRNRVPDICISFLQCDLSHLGSVQTAAKQFITQSSRLDALMCNAGIMAVPPGVSGDGYEIQFATNHLGHALLIKSLLPTMLRTATEESTSVRIVSVTSQGMNMAPQSGIEFDSLNSDQGSIGRPGPWLRYGQSKLANALYIRELARRYPAIKCVSVHPGLVRTDLYAPIGAVERWLMRVCESVRLLSMLEPAEGAFTQTWAATAPETEITSGEYYEGVSDSKEGSKHLQDPSLGQRLWEWTEIALQSFET